MAYSEYLKQILEPLGAYSHKGIGGAELDAIGCELDRYFELLAQCEKESLIITAEDEGLGMYEEILPYVPAYANAGDRRRAILALARIDECSFTEEALNDALAGCGINAAVKELEGERGAVVWFPEIRGIPGNIGALKRRIEEVLPCHIEIIYHYIYTLWGEIEGYFASWAALEKEIERWKDMEIYLREG